MSAERWLQDEPVSTGDAAGLAALCNDGTGDLVTLFYSEQLDDIARAKAICARCPIRESCLEDAVARREPYGVWGGRLFHKGKVLAMKRPRGRPPKNAQVPVPEAPCA